MESELKISSLIDWIIRIFGIWEIIKKVWNWLPRNWIPYSLILSAVYFVGEALRKKQENQWNIFKKNFWRLNCDNIGIEDCVGIKKSLEHELTCVSCQKRYNLLEKEQLQLMEYVFDNTNHEKLIKISKRGEKWKIPSRDKVIFSTVIEKLCHNQSHCAPINNKDFTDELWREKQKIKMGLFEKERKKYMGKQFREGLAVSFLSVIITIPFFIILCKWQC